MPSGVVGTAGVGPGAEETPERRGSTSSEGSAAGSSVHSRSMSAESTEYSARTRITKATPPKPAANPLQFIKVGPCDLYRSAQEQLRRSEEVKKTKEVKKEEQEDWQSNLDNWKSSRRKRVEHIIERCVEVKRLEEEDHERKRRRSKTFNEMMEDRAGRRNSRAPLPIYCEEDNNDLSDLGIGTSSASGKSSLSEDCDNHSLASDGMDLEKNHSDLDNMSSCEIGLRKLGSSANEYDTCTTATISSPEPEEYTYEGAIQSYKSRVISRTQSSDVLASKTNGTNYNMKEKSPEIFTNGSANLRRPSLGNKIENKLSSFEQRRASNVDLTSTESGKKPLPKVDILKRRELFEKESSPESNGVAPKTVTPRTGNFTNSKSIKERLSNLEKLTEDAITTSKNANRLPAEVTSIKNRLSILEKHTSEADKVQVKLSNGSLNKAPSVKDRLSSLKSQKSQEKVPNNSLLSAGMTQTIKERLSNLDSACNKEFASSPEREFDLKIKMNSFDDSEFREDSSFDSHQTNDSSERNSSPESGLYDSKRFHRSLDSLDTDDNMPAEKFERVQSSDDLCGEAGTGADTDREDSGIHTGDVSCAVSQADEPTENLSLTLLGTSANSQDTVIQAESFMSDSPQPELDDLSGKEEYYQAVSHASAVAEDDPPTLDDNTEIFFDREEEDTVKSLEPDTSVSLHDSSATSEVDNVVFEGKMLIHVNFKEICSKMNSIEVDSASNNTNSACNGNNDKAPCEGPLVTVSEMSTNKSSLTSNTSLHTKPDTIHNAGHKPSKNYNNVHVSCNLKKVIIPKNEKFQQSPPILESTGRWTILTINNKTSPNTSLPVTPILDMPEIIPVNLRNDNFEYNCHEEKFVFKIRNNLVTDVKCSHTMSPPASNDDKSNLENVC